MKLKNIFFFNSQKGKINMSKSTPEMTNVLNSIFLCAPLYDKLKVKCHPDIFIDEKDKSIAEDLFKSLQKYRYNYEKLLEIEVQIHNFLEFKTKNKKK